MTVAFQRMFGILERWINNQVRPSLSKPHELSYRSNNKSHCNAISFIFWKHFNLNFRKAFQVSSSLEKSYSEMFVCVQEFYLLSVLKHLLLHNILFDQCIREGLFTRRCDSKIFKHIQ